MGALQILLGLATGGDVLRDRHEVTHRAAWIGHGRDVVRTHSRAPSGSTCLVSVTKPSPVWIACPSRSRRYGRILGIGEVLDAHLQQFRRRALNDFAKSIVDEVNRPVVSICTMPDDRLAEHAAQHLLLLAQPGFDASAHRHVRAQRETRPDSADMNARSSRKDSFEVRARERAAARQRAPGGEADKNERRRRGVARPATQGRPQQRQDGEEAQRAPGTLCSISGLKASAPTTPATTNTAADAPILRRLKGRTSPSAQSTMTGATTSTPAASRSHHVLHVAMTSADSRYPPKTKPATPAVALIIVAPSTTRANFVTPVGVSKVLRPCAQMLIRYPPTTGASVAPAATAKDIMIESAALAPTRSVGTPAA